MKNREAFLSAAKKTHIFTAKAEKICELNFPSPLFRGFQGGCSDGSRHYYQIVMHYDFPDRLRDYGRIAKVDLQTGRAVKWSNDLYLDHANDMTYLPHRHQILVSHNKPNPCRLSVLDADTLEVIGRTELPFPVYAIDYNAKRQQFVVGLSGKREFRFLNADLTPREERTYRTSPETDRYTKQGIGSDEDLLYFILWDGKHKDAPDFQNTIALYDWEGNDRGRIDFNVGVQEPENISMANGKILAICGHTHPILYHLDPILP